MRITQNALVAVHILCGLLYLCPNLHIADATVGKGKVGNQFCGNILSVIGFYPIQLCHLCSAGGGNFQSGNTVIGRKDDLLFARQSLVLEGAGKCSIVMEVSELTVFESHLIRVRLDKSKANPMFYYYYLRSPISPVKTIVSQCAQAGIRGSDLQELKLNFDSNQ